MKIGITAKLFCVILSACALVALAMLVAVRHSFNQGFLGYLNDQENQRIELLLPELAEAYEEHNGWDFLKGNPRAWFTLIRPPGTPLPPDESEPESGQTRSQPPSMPLAQPEVDLTGLNLRVTLLDEHRNPVIGNPVPTSAASVKPIQVGSRTVGWLALLPFEQVSTGAAGRFKEQQFKANAVIGAITIVLATMAALLLARGFIAPLKRIADSTHRLAAGDYDSRIRVSTNDELGRLAEDFNGLALALKKNEQLRRAFMADVSHELRTPLAVLKAELEAVEDGVRPLDMTSIRSLQVEVATLSKLVDDLYELSLSDVGALAYRKQPVDMPELIKAVAAAFGTRFADRSIALALDLNGSPHVICEADPDRLRQMLANLLENSLRYTDAGGKTVVRARTGRSRLVIEIEDTAPGVPQEALPNLFERFYRADPSRSRGTGGAGLGLAISRNIVEAHQGSIVARPSPLGGLAITVTLPIEEGIA